MSTGHCGHCGAMSTIWLPTCVFCGNSLTDGSSGPKPRTRRVIQLALADTPAVGAPSKVIRKCTSRVIPGKTSFLEALRAFFARLTVLRR